MFISVLNGIPHHFLTSQNTGYHVTFSDWKNTRHCIIFFLSQNM